MSDGEKRDADGAVSGSPAAACVKAPRHVAIIMDGNGRWAAQRKLPRFEGHRRGVEALRRTVRNAIDLGVAYLTVYSFSSENWSRPVDEVNGLMGLLKRFIRNDLAELHANNVRIRVIGAREGLPGDIGLLLGEAEGVTCNNSGLVLVVAFNYGGRQEIVAAARALAQDAAAGRLDPADIGPELFASKLDTVDLPDPDLVIRTSGEQRISNFLPWQTAYSEFVFTPTLWPDFDRAAFESALEEFARRERRFGGVEAADPVKKTAS
ncbi:MAG: isoprenyl transferase [Rhodoblastus sp.]